jgi:transposase
VPEYEANQGQEVELKRLKAELKRVTQERDTLKEATVFFVNESKKNARL